MPGLIQIRALVEELVAFAPHTGSCRYCPFFARLPAFYTGGEASFYANASGIEGTHAAAFFRNVSLLDTWVVPELMVLIRLY